MKISTKGYYKIKMINMEIKELINLLPEDYEKECYEKKAIRRKRIIKTSLASSLMFSFCCIISIMQNNVVFLYCIKPKAAIILLIPAS